MYWTQRICHGSLIFLGLIYVPVLIPWWNPRFDAMSRMDIAEFGDFLRTIGIEPMPLAGRIPSDCWTQCLCNNNGKLSWNIYIYFYGPLSTQLGNCINNQRVYRYISETLVGMFVWKLLKTARGTPQKMDKIRSIDHLWNGTVASAAVSLPGGHWSSPWLQYSGAARVSSEPFFCVLSCCGLVETQQFPDRCTDVPELFLGFESLRLVRLDFCCCV